MPQFQTAMNMKNLHLQVKVVHLQVKVYLLSKMWRPKTFESDYQKGILRDWGDIDGFGVIEGGRDLYTPRVMVHTNNVLEYSLSSTELGPYPTYCPLKLSIFPFKSCRYSGSIGLQGWTHFSPLTSLETSPKLLVYIKTFTYLLGHFNH